MATNSLNPFRVYFKLAFKFVLLAGLLIAASYVGDWISDQLNPHLTPSTEPALHRIIMTAIVAYILLMMLPFVPGVEIGIAMMIMFGPEIAPLVYGSTVLALALSFFVGRLVPQSAIIEVFETLHLKRAGHLLRRLEELEPSKRLQFLVQNASSRMVPVLLRHRFLALLVALNLPGNVVVGGGGGIALFAGISRLYSVQGYLATIAVAVAPVPLAVFVFGSDFLKCL